MPEAALMQTAGRMLHCDNEGQRLLRLHTIGFWTQAMLETVHLLEVFLTVLHRQSWTRMAPMELDRSAEAHCLSHSSRSCDA